MGRPLAPWRDEVAAKQCAWCEQEFRPREREIRMDWDRRQTCSPKCRQALGGHRRRLRSSPPQLQDRDWLEAEYIGNQRATPSIAAEVGCSAGTVIEALRRLGIPMRTQSEERRKHHKFLITKEWLQAEYLDNGRSALQLALEVNCSTITIINTLHRLGLPVRDENAARAENLRRMNDKRRRPTKARKLSFAQKQQVKKLNDRCAWCRKTEDLEVHHRDADRANDDLSNLVVLCHSCHAGIEWFIAPVEQRLRTHS